MSLFSCYFKIFSLFLTFIWQFDYDVSCVDLFILLGIHWALWMCRLLLLDISSNILFALFSLSLSFPSVTLMMCMLICFMRSHRSPKFYSFSSFFFIHFLRPSNFNQHNFNLLIISSASSNVLLRLFSKICISVILYF